MNKKPLPHTPNLDKWIEECVKQAQGKRQIALAKKFSDEYKALKMHVLDLTVETNANASDSEG